MAQTLVLQRFSDAASAAAAAATVIAEGLAAGIAGRGTASLIATGGRTPGAVYAALSGAAIDWSRVQVSLSDERWVGEESAQSNTRLVREGLLTGPAAQARFVGLETGHAEPGDAA